MQRRAKIGTVFAGMIAALAVGGAVAPQAQAAGNETELRACMVNMTIHVAREAAADQYLHELQHQPHTVEQLIVAEANRRAEEAALETARQLHWQGRFAECAAV